MERGFPLALAVIARMGIALLKQQGYLYSYAAFSVQKRTTSTRSSP
jgi:hypothetical protein